MPWKESLIEKLARLTREHEAKRRPEEWLAEQMWWQDWEGLTRQARVIAVRALKGRRGGGVLPDGYDAESVAGEAIAGLFSGATPLVLGMTRARLAGQLERLVRGRIRKLEKRKERALVGAEWTADGSVLMGVRHDSADGYQALAAREAEEERERLKEKVKGLLAEEPELAALFECRWLGLTKADEIGRRLGMSEAEVVRARKRLDRRMAAWQKANKLGALTQCGAGTSWAQAKSV